MAGIGVGGETDTVRGGRPVRGSLLLQLVLLLLLPLLLLEVVSELEVDSSELEMLLLLLLLLLRLRVWRGRSLGLDSAVVAFVSCAASRVVCAGVVAVVVVVLEDAPTLCGRASWCMALKLSTGFSTHKKLFINLFCS